MTAQPAPTLYRVFGRDGEYDRAAMKQLIRQGEVTSLTDVTISGRDEWKSAGMYPELQRYLALASTPQTEAVASAAKKADNKQLIAAVVLMIVGLFFGISGTADLVRGFASMTWPAATDAQLISADVTGSDYSYRGSRRSRARLRVVYRYRAAGRLYLGDRVSFGREWMTSAHRQRNEAQRDFRVYYSPSMPRTSVMRRGPTGGAATASFGGLAGVVIGYLALFRPETLQRLRRRIPASGPTVS